VLRAAIRELLARRTSTLLSGLGLLAAVVGFTLLAMTSKTTEATLRGDIATSWNTPYDLLVLPHGERLGAVQGDNAVQPNAFTVLPGGITLAQLTAIRAIPGVQVAAPVASVGYVDYAPAAVYESLGGLPRTPGLTVYRITATTTADAGMTHIQGYADYVAMPDGNDLWRVVTGGQGMQTVLTPAGRLRCLGGHVFCFGTAAPVDPLTATLAGPAMTYRRNFRLTIPVVGVDPQAEAQLFGLDRCISTGRYLSAGDVPALTKLSADSGFPGAPLPAIPVLANNQPQVQDDDTLVVEMADDATSLMKPGGVLDDKAVAGLRRWHRVATWSVSFGGQFGAQFLGAPTSSLPRRRQIQDARPPITASPVHYDVEGDAQHLRARTVPGDATDVYSNNPFSIPSSDLTPPATTDAWFRALAVHRDLVADTLFGGYPSNNPTRVYDVVGTYNPSCAGWQQLAGATGLDLYSYAMHRLPNGGELRPSASIGSYAGTPPLFLTTLATAQYFADPDRFDATPGDAFISLVRVRVEGAANPGPVGEARLTRIAADIHARTGLDVDVVKGTSPKTVHVDVPAGRFGRPALQVTESWAVLGAGYRFEQQLAPQNAALFTLVLAAAGILTGQTTFTAVRRRRRQLALLRALGWPRWRLAALVELETVLLGGAVGVVGVVAALTIGWRMGVDAATVRSVTVVLPLAVAIAGVAGVVPAVSAARRGVLPVMQGRGRVRRSHARASRSMIAVRELLTTWRMESCLGALAIALGAGLLGGVVLVEVAFRGTLDTTVLGRYLTAEVQPFHVALGVIAFLIGMLASSQILLLSYLERLPHMATLRALGWPRSHVGAFVAAQAATLGLIAAALATAGVVGVGLVIHAATGGIVVAAVAGASIALLGGLVASVGPVAMVYSRSVVSALSE
jgi:hypothetical protein